MNEVLNAKAISKRDSFCIRIQESFKNMNCSDDCEDIPSILAEFEEYVKSDQQAEIERLTEELNDWKQRSDGHQFNADYHLKRNAELQKQVAELTERLSYFQKSSDYHEGNQKELEIRNADLQKQVDELKERLHMIWALGVDYDGCDKVESLKGLIDELVKITQMESKEFAGYYTGVEI